MKVIIGSLILFMGCNLFSMDEATFDVYEQIFDYKPWKGSIYAIDFKSDTVFFLEPHIKKDSNQYYFELMETVDSTKIIHKLLLPEYKRIDVVDICVNDELYCLLDLQNVWCFNRRNNNFLRKIILPNTFTNISFNDSNILELSMCGFSSYNKDSISQTYCCNYDFKLDKINYFTFPNPLSINLTYIRRKVHSYRNNLFAIAEPLKYQITIYNVENNDTLLIKLDKINPSINGIKKENNHDPKSIKYIFYDLVSQRDSLQLIDFINFIGDDSLAVIWSSPSKDSKKVRNLYLDLWKINENGFSKILENVSVDKKLIKNEIYQPSFSNILYKSGYFYKVEKNSINLLYDESKSSSFNNLKEEENLKLYRMILK